MARQPKEESPFGLDGRQELIADVNAHWMGERDFSSYGIGYFNAADLLARTIVNAKTGKWMEWSLDDENIEWLVGNVYLDTLLFPLLGLYRQGTELMLKHFIYDRPNAPKFDKAARQHLLNELWHQAREQIKILGFDDKNPDIEKITVFVEKLCKLDPKGEASRFPSDRDRKLFFEEYGKINLDPLIKEGHEVGEILYALCEERIETNSYQREDE